MLVLKVSAENRTLQKEVRRTSFIHTYIHTYIHTELQPCYVLFRGIPVELKEVELALSRARSELSQRERTASAKASTFQQDRYVCIYMHVCMYMCSGSLCMYEYRDNLGKMFESYDELEHQAEEFRTQKIDEVAQSRMYVCMYVCMCVYMFICMFVCAVWKFCYCIFLYFFVILFHTYDIYHFYIHMYSHTYIHTTYIHTYDGPPFI